jgi:hypothetical protein
MDGYKLRLRVEIVPTAETDGCGPQQCGLDGVDEEAVEMISATKATSIDEMEETLLENGYEVMRRALSKHLTEVSKRGLSNGPAPAN